MTTRDEISELLIGFCKAVANQDTAGVGDYYATDARLLPPGAPLIEGRAGIESYLGELFAAGFRSLELDTVDVLEDGGLAVEVGRFTMGFDPSATEVGKYIAVYRRQSDGTLKIVADTFNSDTPAP